MDSTLRYQLLALSDPIGRTMDVIAHADYSGNVFRTLAFNPHQPRAGKSTPAGGQWINASETQVDAAWKKLKALVGWSQKVELKLLFGADKVLPRDIADNLVLKGGPKGELVDVPLSSLKFLESKVGASAVVRMLEERKDVARSYRSDPPVVLRSRDHGLVLMDGHHRAVAAFLAGDKTIRAAVVPASRQYSEEGALEERIDFAQVGKQLDSLEMRFARDLSEALSVVKEELIQELKDQEEDGDTPGEIMDALELPAWDRVADAMRDGVRRAWDAGSDTARGELESIKGFAYNPDQPRDDQGRWVDENFKKSWDDSWFGGGLFSGSAAISELKELSSDEKKAVRAYKLGGQVNERLLQSAILKVKAPVSGFLYHGSKSDFKLGQELKGIQSWSGSSKIGVRFADQGTVLVHRIQAGDSALPIRGRNFRSEAEFLLPASNSYRVVEVTEYQPRPHLVPIKVAFVEPIKKFAQWDESKHPRHPAGDDRGGEFASQEAQMIRDRFADMGFAAQRLKLPIAPGIKSENPSCGFGVCTDVALDEFRDSGAEIYVGYAVPAKDFHSAVKQHSPENWSAPLNAVPHAWNVRDGKIVDRALGSSMAKEHVYIGARVPAQVAQQLKSGDQLTKWGDLFKGYAQWEASFVAQPQFLPRSAMDWLKQKAFWITGVLSDQLTNDVRGAILKMLKTGALMSDTIARIEEIFAPFLLSGKQGQPLSPGRIETIVRTNVMDAYNHGRLSEMMDPDLIPLLDGVKYSAILDTRTTEICRFLHGKIFRPNDPALTELLPPNHFNCRSLIVPLVLKKLKPGDFITRGEVAYARSITDERFLTQEDEVLVFYDPDQERYPKGHPQGGQWKPVLDNVSPLTKERRAAMTPEQLEEYRRKARERRKKRMEKRRLEAGLKPPIPGPIDPPILPGKIPTSAFGDVVRKNINDTAAIRDWLMANEANFRTAELKAHRMSFKEEFKMVKLDHLRIYYPPDGTGRSVAAITAADYMRSKMPYEVTRFTSAIILTKQAANTDAAKRAMGRNVRTIATGGDGRMVGYGGYAIAKETTTHEFGHNLATGLYGFSSPPQDYSPIGKLWAKWEHKLAGYESPVTAYAKTNSAESYAEATEAYLLTPKAMQRNYPQHYKAMEEEFAKAKERWKQDQP